jgi:hypothetical protein
MQTSRSVSGSWLLPARSPTHGTELAVRLPALDVVQGCVTIPVPRGAPEDGAPQLLGAIVHVADRATPK